MCVFFYHNLPLLGQAAATAAAAAVPAVAAAAL